jgi:hypothetical protein
MRNLLIILAVVFNFSQTIYTQIQQKLPATSKEKLSYKEIVKELETQQKQHDYTIPVLSAKTINYQLDSVVTFKKTAVNDSCVIRRRAYQYNSGNLKINDIYYNPKFETSSFFNSFRYISSSSTEYSYNKYGKIETAITQELGIQISSISMRVINEIAKIDTTFSPLNLLSKEEYLYNSKSFPLKRIQSQFYDNNWQNYITYKYTCDSVGNIVTDSGFYDPALKTPYFINKYLYNAFGNKLSEMNYTRISKLDRLGLTSQKKYDYSYNPDLTIDSVVYYYWSFTKSQWIANFKAKYFYSPNGQKQSQIYSLLDSASNQLKLANKSEYIYNTDNKQISTLNYAYNKTKNAWEFASREKFYYSITEVSDIANLPHTPATILYPNPVKDYLNIDITENTSGSISIIQVDGKAAGAYKVQPGKNQINLSHLKKGLYFVNIFSSNGKSSVKLVKE